MKFAAIVVLYEPHIQDYKHIITYIDKIDYLFIIDNSENNNYKIISDLLCDFIDKYEYVHNGSNIGLCAALNLGIDLSIKKGYKWTIVMDSDSSWKNNIVDVYKKVMNQYCKVAVFSPVHIYDRKVVDEYDGEKKVKWAMTSGCCFNNDIFKSVGGFNEKLFVDGLDMDYCYRVKEKGYEVVECGMAQLIHNPAETVEFCILNKCLFKYGMASEWRYYMQARALTWVVLRYKHINDIIFYFWKWIKVIFLFKGKKKYIKNMIKGTSEGIDLWYEYKRN